MFEIHSVIKLSTVGSLRRLFSCLSSFPCLRLQGPLKIRKREVVGRGREKEGRRGKENKPRQRDVLTRFVFRYSSFHLRFQTDFWWGIHLSFPCTHMCVPLPVSVTKGAECQQAFRQGGRALGSRPRCPVSQGQDRLTYTVKGRRYP